MTDYLVRYKVQKIDGKSEILKAEHEFSTYSNPQAEKIAEKHEEELRKKFPGSRITLTELFKKISLNKPSTKSVSV